MADSREADYAMNPNETEAFQPGAGSQDFNSNREDEPQKVGKKVSDYALAEHNVAFPVQGIPAAGIPSDPSLRQAYAMPATGHGLTLAQNSNQSSPSRYYKMASDIFGTGMDKTWTASSGPGNNAPQNPITGNPMSQRHVPNSFKITEMSANTNAGNEEQAEAGATGAGRRARESSGNPLTGQGFNQENAKTGKRYFEGSNANQKLW